MSTTILAGDIRVYFLDENRQKRAEWIGAATGTRTANEIYSAFEDLMDEPGQSDDGSVMSAETPVEYTVGNIDAGDIDPWYFSYDMMEHIVGGAVKSAGWTRVTSSNSGIIVVEVTSNTILEASLGLDISGATDGIGTLLEIIEAGTTDYLVIRPDTSAAGADFTTAAQVITCNATTATQTNAFSTTGEQIWANLYNVTPIEADTHVYLYQGTVADATRARIGRISNAAGDWWEEGAFDRLFFINDFKSAGFPAIDGGYLTVFARKGNTLYDSFEVAASTVSGGRNPVPLKAANDINHTAGYLSITTTAVGTDDFTVGDEIQDDTSGARGIITQIDGVSPTYTFYYYTVGDPQVAFTTAAATITNNDATGSATSDTSAPVDQGPGLATWFTNNAFPTIAYANTTFDIDDDGTAEGWGITIDCNGNPLTEVYEWLQHIGRNGGTTTGNTDGIEGEQYVGATVFLEYSGSVTLGTLAEGDDVIQTTSGATGIIISHDTTLKQILLRDTRGTFTTADAVVSQDNSGSVVPDVTAIVFTANTASPFGTFAGGRFFGARGVLLTDYVSADENSFQLVDAQGTGRQRKIAFQLEVTNLEGGAETASDSDYISLYRLLGAGLGIDKTEYSAAGGEAIGDPTLTVDASITADTPGKTVGGTLVIRDADDNNQEYRVRYDSWNGSIFTLSNIVIASADASTTTTVVIKAGAFGTAKRGDFVYNSTRSLYAYVLTVDSANQITLDREIAGQVPTDAIELNACPIVIDTLDDVYVALMGKYATAATETVTIVYNASVINYRAKATNKRNATKIKPFVTSDSTSGTDRSIAVIRQTDTIAS